MNSLVNLQKLTDDRYLLRSEEVSGSLDVVLQAKSAAYRIFQVMDRVIQEWRFPENRALSGSLFGYQPSDYCVLMSQGLLPDFSGWRTVVSTDVVARKYQAFSCFIDTLDFGIPGMRQILPREMFSLLERIPIDTIIQNGRMIQGFVRQPIVHGVSQTLCLGHQFQHLVFSDLSMFNIASFTTTVLSSVRLPLLGRLCPASGAALDLAEQTFSILQDRSILESSLSSNRLMTALFSMAAAANISAIANTVLQLPSFPAHRALMQTANDIFEGPPTKGMRIIYRNASMLSRLGGVPRLFLTAYAPGIFSLLNLGWVIHNVRCYPLTRASFAIEEAETLRRAGNLAAAKKYLQKTMRDSWVIHTAVLEKYLACVDFLDSIEDLKEEDVIKVQESMPIFDGVLQALKTVESISELSLRLRFLKIVAYLNTEQYERVNQGLLQENFDSKMEGYMVDYLIDKTERLCREVPGETGERYLRERSSKLQLLKWKSWIDLYVDYIISCREGSVHKMLESGPPKIHHVVANDLIEKADRYCQNFEYDKAKRILTEKNAELGNLFQDKILIEKYIVYILCCGKLTADFSERIEVIQEVLAQIPSNEDFLELSSKLQTEKSVYLLTESDAKEEQSFVFV